ECSRDVRTAAPPIGIVVALGGCLRTGEEVTTASMPDDYLLSHPLVIEEANKSIAVFVGQGRGGLSAEQRTDVVGLAESWLHEATGAINADLPVGTPNARMAADSMREIQALLAAAGVPARGIVVRQYHPENPRHMAAIRLSYPKITAEAGPCGLWPEDIGPSIKNKSYLENKQYYNFGCAYQRNMAAMVDNPADLVQPRPETPPHTMRRTASFTKYRARAPTTTHD